MCDYCRIVDVFGKKLKKSSTYAKYVSPHYHPLWQEEMYKAPASVFADSMEYDSTTDQRSLVFN